MTSDLSSLPPGVLVVLALLVAVTLVLDVVALVDLYRRPARLLTFGNKWMWLVLILLLNLLGPILYLVAGRRPAPHSGESPAVRHTNPNAAADAANKLYGPRDHPDPP
ncbi:PLDc N-terminal domain-containing protein [Arthrobacter sp. SA17]